MSEVQEAQAHAVEISEKVREYKLVITPEELDKKYEALLQDIGWRSRNSIGPNFNQKLFNELRNSIPKSLSSLRWRDYVTIRVAPFIEYDRNNTSTTHYGYNVFRESAVPYYDALSSVLGITQDMVFQEYWKLNKYVQAWKRLINGPTNASLVAEIPSYAPTLLAEMQDNEDITKPRIRKMLLEEFKDDVDFKALGTKYPALVPYMPESLMADKVEAKSRSTVRSLIDKILRK